MAENIDCPWLYRCMSHNVKNNLQNKNSHNVGYLRAALKDNTENLRPTRYNLSQVNKISNS